MTNAEFIERFRLAVYESSIKAVTDLLQKPPGRRPPESLVALSRWFNQLSPDDRDRVRATIQLATHQAVFGMLTVLDGARSITVAGEAGSIEVRYKTEEQSIPLNDPEGDALHELFC